MAFCLSSSARVSLSEAKILRTTNKPAITTIARRIQEIHFLKLAMLHLQAIALFAYREFLGEFLDDRFFTG